METRDDTIATLRQRLGREPTNVEIDEARRALIRRAYAAMTLTDVLLRDEAK